MLNSPFILGLLGNIMIALGVISLLFVTDTLRRKTMKKMDNLIALTVGLILAIVLLGFIPEVIDHGNISGATLGILLLLGMLLFYVLELFLHWHHCKDLGEKHGDHHHDHHIHEHGNNSLMFAGTLAHNIIHGIVLFSAFSVDINFGIATTLAILLHAIPQNIANLLMNHKDVRFAYIAAFGGIIGALILFPFQEILSEYMFHVLAVIGGGLLYTAMSDMLPSFTGNAALKNKTFYLAFMILGVGIFYSSSLLLPDSHNHSQNEEHTHENDDEYKQEVIQNNILQEVERDFSDPILKEESHDAHEGEDQHHDDHDHE